MFKSLVGLQRFGQFSFSSSSLYVHLPHKENVEVPCSQIKALFLSSGEAKAHGEHRQGQGEQPSKNKQDSPDGEAVKPRQEDHL